MTWSIIAKDETTGAIGIAVASKFFALGAQVPAIEVDAGAIASQALMNPLYRPRGLALLRERVPAQDVVRLLTDADPGREHRQLHLMDRDGRFAARTGAECIGWCGHLAGENFSVAGNMLAGPQVIERTARAFEAGSGTPFARRLIAALKAGEDAGGDKRGKQSAALLIYSTQDYPDLDLRVDDHTDPLPELERLERVSRERWVHFRQFLPTRQDPAGTTDRSVIEAAIARAVAEAQDAR